MIGFRGTGTLACAPSAWQRSFAHGHRFEIFVNRAQARLPVLRKL